MFLSNLDMLLCISWSIPWHFLLPKRGQRRDFFSKLFIISIETRKESTSLTLHGSGQFLTIFTLSRYFKIPSSEMTCPKYNTLLAISVHFIAFSFWLDKKPIKHGSTVLEHVFRHLLFDYNTIKVD